jgi:hypothetical protein
MGNIKILYSNKCPVMYERSALGRNNYAIVDCRLSTFGLNL